VFRASFGEASFFLLHNQLFSEPNLTGKSVLRRQRGTFVVREKSWPSDFDFGNEKRPIWRLKQRPARLVGFGFLGEL